MVYENVLENHSKAIFLYVETPFPTNRTYKLNQFHFASKFLKKDRNQFIYLIKYVHVKIHQTHMQPYNLIPNGFLILDFFWLDSII